jgi:hypothetical protein
LKTHGNCENIPRNYLDRTRDKRILLIDTIVPLPDQDSGSIDTFNYLRILLSMGYSVSFLPYCTTASNSYIHGLQRMGVRVFHDPFYVDFQSIIQAEAPKADIIFIYRGVAHDYLPMLRAIVPDKPIIFNTVDLHFVRLERAAELSGKGARF